MTPERLAAIKSRILKNRSAPDIDELALEVCEALEAHIVPMGEGHVPEVEGVFHAATFDPDAPVMSAPKVDVAEAEVPHRSHAKKAHK